MQRITISVSEALSAELDQMQQDGGYRTRSETVRDLVRDGIERWREARAEAEFCVANLSYVFDRRVRALPLRLTEMQNEHHDLVVASTAVRLDHYYTMESVMLRGTASALRAFADLVRAERGVRSSTVNVLRVDTHDDHNDDAAHHHTGHAHLSPVG